jgi:farnesyl-diphosphate farnesyltransferase
VTSVRSVRDAEIFCREILPDVSRTFAISIKLLPGELGRAVLCAYLLCRIADTIEDDASLVATRRSELFLSMLEAFTTSEAAERFTLEAATLVGQPAYADLAHHADRVFAVWESLPPVTRECVRRWVTEMVHGMRAVVLRYPGGIRLQTLQEYREYCYYVAGTVGFMLTDLWRAHSRAVTPSVYDALKEHARAFGEALQTVNILKDVAQDAEFENAVFVPEELLRAHGSSHATILDAAHETANRAALSELIELAWKDLDDAREYLMRVPRRALAVRLFCVLPLLYAYATVRELTRSRAMLRPGGSVKIARTEVRVLLVLGMLCAPSNTALSALIHRVRTLPTEM